MFCPNQLVSCDAMEVSRATTELHVLQHRDTWWTVEWEDHGKVRQATAHAPQNAVPPLPRGGDCLQLPARVPDIPEAACEALHNALYWAQGAPGGPLPPEHTHAWTCHATCLATHMRPDGAAAGQRLLTWPTDPPETCRRTRRRLAS